VSLLIKAGTGLVAGMVAGALGLVFLPRPEPNAVKPRTAVEKPQFVVASASPTAVPAPRAAPAVALAAVAPEEDKAAAPQPRPSPATEAKAPPPAVTPPQPAPAALQPKAAPAPVAVAKIDPPKPAAVSPSPSSPPSTVAEVAPRVAPSPAYTMPTAPTPAIAASDASAPWSVRGLVALAKGDLSSARVYLTRAADAGDPRAFVALADTYDPTILAKLGVVCAPGDSQRAKDYLVKAAAAGVVAARDRMAALEQNAH